MNPSIGLRPYLPQDASTLVAIFIASVEELAAEDYSVDQIAAWTAPADDAAQFGARLAGQLTLVATFNGEPVGFASCKGVDQIDMLYVQPLVARQGVASALCDALEKLALARGAKHLSVDASDCAEPFFLQRGSLISKVGGVLLIVIGLLQVTGLWSDVMINLRSLISDFVPVI